MKKFYKGIVAAVLLVALISSTVVTSYAAGIDVVVDVIMGGVVDKVIDYTFKPTTVNEGEDEIVAAMNYLNSVWRTPGNCTGTVDVTYRTMSDLVADLNMNGIPCQIGMWRGSGATGYVIRGTGKAPVCGGVAKVDITGKYLTNTVGAAFLAKSKSEITTPDTSTTTPTTPTITFDDTNIVNAVEGVFDQLTWVIRCQFEQMQDTLLNGRILLNINNLISKNVIPFLEDILVADTATSSTLQALYHSFESKFSDLDTIFGTDTSMEVHNGDLLTWDNLSRGFTSAEADGTATTICLTPTRTLSGYNVGWTSDGNFSITPVGGGYFPDTLDVGTGTVTMPVIQTTETTTVANPKLNQYVPEGYTQYERCSGAIDLGITPQSGMMLDTGLALTSTTSLSRLQYFFGADGLSMAISEDKQSLVVTSGSSTYNWAHDFSTNKTLLVHLYWTFGSSWRLGSMSSGASLTGFPSNPKTLYLAGVNTTSSYTRPSSNWHDIQFKDASGNLLYHFVPVKRDSDGTAGLYRVEYNAGVYSGGTFLTAKYVNVYDEIPATVETTVTKSGNITRIYRDTSNTWRAVDSEGTVHGFTAASAQVLWDAFPIYDYNSLSDLTSLPDGTYRFTWEGTAQTVTINYQAYSKWFAYIANQIAYNRNWLDKRLDQLSFSTGDITMSPTDLTDVTVRMDTIIDLLQATSGDTACEHTYEQDMTTEATCALPGLMVSTCSKCGDSYSEIVDPLGHDWQCTDHVAAETDPETGEETAAAYDIYTCSRCGDTYNDYSGDGAPEDYGKSSISQLIVELFSRLGKLVGSLLGFVVNVFDKALTSVDDLISRFNSYTEQITGFGGAYPAWLGGVWGILPADLQVALTFAVVCMAVALVGKKLVFS